MTTKTKKAPRKSKGRSLAAGTVRMVQGWFDAVERWSVSWTGTDGEEHNVKIDGTEAQVRERIAETLHCEPEEIEARRTEAPYEDDTTPDEPGDRQGLLPEPKNPLSAWDEAAYFVHGYFIMPWPMQNHLEHVEQHEKDRLARGNDMTEAEVDIWARHIDAHRTMRVKQAFDAAADIVISEVDRLKRETPSLGYVFDEYDTVLALSKTLKTAMGALAISGTQNDVMPFIRLALDNAVKSAGAGLRLVAVLQDLTLKGRIVPKGEENQGNLIDDLQKQKASDDTPLSRMAAAWNHEHPVGTKFRFKKPDGSFLEVISATYAFEYRGDLCVDLVGWKDCVSIDKLEPIEGDDEL